jgi:hypothetical protein
VRIIVLLVLFAVLFIAFIAIQIWKQETATVPPRIASQCSIICGMLYAFACSSAMLVFVFYIPVWFQAIKGVSPMKSGIDVIPMILELVLGTILAGGFIQRDADVRWSRAYHDVGGRYQSLKVDRVPGAAWLRYRHRHAVGFHGSSGRPG